MPAQHAICTTACLDSATLQGCTSTGERIVVSCLEGETCESATCARPEDRQEEQRSSCLGGVEQPFLGMVAVGAWRRRKKVA